MGYRKLTIKYVHDMIELAGFQLKGLEMLELGNQLIWDKDGYQGFFVAKDYFESFGVHHESIDRNGKNGSLPLDLNKKINLDGDGFDVVTNMGTSEHVKNNKSCFDNIHNLCKVGGIMIHLVPHKGSGHGIRQYTLKFFEDLVDKRKYEILHLERNGKYEWKETENRRYCTVRKNNGN